MNLRKYFSKNPSRFIEIDLIRGYTLLLMAFYHLLWDLDYFGILPLDQGFYSATVKIVPVAFFTIVGISLSISFDRSHNYRAVLQHGAVILICGVFLSLFSFFLLPESPIYFGVLHCIGTSILLSVFFIRFKKLNLTFSLIILFSGFIISFAVPNPDFLTYILGIHSNTVLYRSVDYFPIFPWFGYVLLGIAIGKILYKDGKRQFMVPELKDHTSRLLSFCGRHSLSLYLAHQPVIAGTLKILLFLHII